VAALLVVATWAIRLLLLRAHAFDPDEFEHLHGAWCIAHGMLPYRDYFEHHTPWLHFLLAPFVSAFDVDHDPDRAVSFVFLARQGMWALTGLAVAATWVLGRLWAGARVAWTAAALLSITVAFFDKTLEVRPDVPALACLVASWTVTLAALRGDPARGAIKALFAASGVFLGAAILFTQKVLFTVPAAAALMLWHVLEPRDGGRMRAKLGGAVYFVAGLLAPVVLTLAFFASRGALAAFVDDNLLLNLRWKFRTSTLPVARSIALDNPVLTVLAFVGLIVTVARAAAPGSLRRGDALIAVHALGLLAGALLISVAYTQYFLMLFPLAALLAAALLVRLVDAIAGLAARWRSLPGLADALLGPHAYYYFFLHEEIRALLGPAERSRLVAALRDGELAPKLVLLDHDLLHLAPEAVDFFRQNYDSLGDGVVWTRKPVWLDDQRLAGRLELGEGPTDALVGRGWYPPERESGRSVRRTRGRRSTIRIPVRAATHTRIGIHARLEFVAVPVRLELLVNELPCGETALETGWRDYVFRVPPGALRAGINRVRLNASASPRDVDAGHAGRNSVMAVDYLQLMGDGVRP
jgi:hypothetical protein